MGWLLTHSSWRPAADTAQQLGATQLQANSGHPNMFCCRDASTSLAGRGARVFWGQRHRVALARCFQRMV